MRGARRGRGPPAFGGWGSEWAGRRGARTSTSMSGCSYTKWSSSDACPPSRGLCAARGSGADPPLSGGRGGAPWWCSRWTHRPMSWSGSARPRRTPSQSTHPWRKGSRSFGNGPKGNGSDRMWFTPSGIQGQMLKQPPYNIRRVGLTHYSATGVKRLQGEAGAGQGAAPPGRLESRGAPPAHAARRRRRPWPLEPFPSAPSRPPAR